jgi:hypothetical protein
VAKGSSCGARRQRAVAVAFHSSETPRKESLKRAASTSAARSTRVDRVRGLQRRASLPIDNSARATAPGPRKAQKQAKGSTFTSPATANARARRRSTRAQGAPGVFASITRERATGIVQAMPPQQDKRVLYVGGLSEEATEETLHAAFVPFGDVKEVNIPRDFAGQTNDANRGFAFVTFELENDAAEALYNMDGSELFGRVLRVNVARAMSHKLGSSKAVWSADSWFQESLTEEGVGKESAAPPPG